MCHVFWSDLHDLVLSCEILLKRFCFSFERKDTKLISHIAFGSFMAKSDDSIFCIMKLLAA